MSITIIFKKTKYQKLTYIENILNSMKVGYSIVYKGAPAEHISVTCSKDKAIEILNLIK